MYCAKVEFIWQPCTQEAERIQRMDKKLSSLHLDGLVDFAEQAAKFVVLGSTKNHYTVTLSDDRHSCQCVDFRCNPSPNPDLALPWQA